MAFLVFLHCLLPFRILFNVEEIFFFFHQKHFSGAVDRVIQNDLEVLCKLYEEGCKWFGAISDYQVGINLIFIVNMILFLHYKIFFSFV